MTCENINLFEFFLPPLRQTYTGKVWVGKNTVGIFEYLNDFLDLL